VTDRARPAIHPIAWIAWVSAASLISLSTTDPVYLLLLWATAWFVCQAQRIPGPMARSFRMFLAAGVITVVLRTALVLFTPVGSRDVLFALLEGLRLGTLLVLFGTFNAVTDPFGLVRLAPKHFHEPALATALALSITPRTVASVGKVREAQRLRGLSTGGLRSLPALVVPVLERGIEEAGTLAESMDARGHGRGPRTRYRPERWSTASLAVVGAAAVGAAAFVATAVTARVPLHPATDPLALSSPDPVLLGAIALLALPGLMPGGADR